MKNLGERVVNLRRVKNIKQFQLANLIGISKMTLYKYENLISEPRATIIRNLADVLDTTSDYLLNRIDDPLPFEKGDAWLRLRPSEANLLQKMRSLPEPYRQKIYERIDYYIDNLNKSGVRSFSGNDVQR